MRIRSYLSILSKSKHAWSRIRKYLSILSKSRHAWQGVESGNIYISILSKSRHAWHGVESGLVEDGVVVDVDGQADLPQVLKPGNGKSRDDGTLSG